ncbi:uncharacterized protein LOC133496039 isoform X5 [Syngnathoides biaculeatus]|uniref:uncharacterized protein LOC133496039 isoform X5 n=1 Tax=Syngnathoides biaculeatus TaxID=300417 RepID=UPI002ADD6628|nr:uncharacterized protein LOC133496039 isoform X5 [Syngnathoides biaculeatus]
MGHKCSQKCPRSESLMQMKARLMKDEKANTCLCFKEEKKGREPSLAQGHLGSRQEASRHPCDSLLPYFVCSGTRPVPWAKQKLFRRDPKAFPSQQKNMVSSACPGSSMGSLSGGTCPEHLKEGVWEASESDAPATSSGSSQCRGAGARQRASPG